MPPMQAKETHEETISEETRSEGQMTDEIRIVFDGPPGPEAGRFVEAEDASGKSINVGEWHSRPDGLWELRIMVSGHRCPICGIPNPELMNLDGCRDPDCTEQRY